ncbi:MAG: polyprenyl synthetase family protein [Bacteroidales bacterium]|nr:polyprenyl synthetase family protein [Bacteroidales bacterium]
MHSDKELLGIINSHIASLSFGKVPQNLYDPVYYSLSAGGKRIRPVLCLMAAELFGGNIEKILDVACGIEIFHNFTLLHDDMMDNASVRRGNPTVHIKWTDNIALLSGDAMSVIAYKYISKAQNLKETLDVFSDTALKICEGQQFDMDFESRNDVSVDEYLNMINLKTAVLLAASLKIGAIEANAAESDKQNIYEFGRNLGMAFQLQDDYLDTYGNVEKFGKNIGGDIVSNKKTYLLIKALELASGKEKEELNLWLAKKDFNNEEKIAAVKKIYDKLEIAKKSQLLMEFYFEKAEEFFSKLSISNENKDTLKKFTDSLRERNY